MSTFTEKVQEKAQEVKETVQQLKDDAASRFASVKDEAASRFGSAQDAASSKLNTATEQAQQMKDAAASKYASATGMASDSAQHAREAAQAKLKQAQIEFQNAQNQLYETMGLQKPYSHMTYYEQLKYNWANLDWYTFGFFLIFFGVLIALVKKMQCAGAFQRLLFDCKEVPSKKTFFVKTFPAGNSSECWKNMQDLKKLFMDIRGEEVVEIWQEGNDRNSSGYALGFTANDASDNVKNMLSKNGYKSLSLESGLDAVHLTFPDEPFLFHILGMARVRAAAGKYFKKNNLSLSQCVIIKSKKHNICEFYFLKSPSTDLQKTLNY